MRIHVVSKNIAAADKNPQNLSAYPRSVKDSNLLEMTSLKKLPSETRTEALLVKYAAYFGIFQYFRSEKNDSQTGIIENLRAS